MAPMDLGPYLQEIRRQLDLAAEAGGEEAREVAERIAAPLEASIRLALQDALTAAAEEITVELAPGSVELRLRGRDPDLSDAELHGDGDGVGRFERWHR